MDFLNDLNGYIRRDGEQTRKALRAALRALYRMIFVEGFMTEVDRSERLKFAEFFYAMAVNDGARCAQITLETASFSPPDLAYARFESDVTALVDRVSGTKVSEYQIADFVLSLFDLQRRYRIRGTSAFTMAIVSLLVFEGIAKEVYPDLDFQYEARPFILRASLRPYRPFDETPQIGYPRAVE